MEERICSFCGEEINGSCYSLDFNGNVICNECYTSEHSVCDICGEVFPNDLGDDYSCEGMFICPDCSEGQKRGR